MLDYDYLMTKRILNLSRTYHIPCLLDGDKSYIGETRRILQYQCIAVAIMKEIIQECYSAY